MGFFVSLSRITDYKTGTSILLQWKANMSPRIQLTGEIYKAPDPTNMSCKQRIGNEVILFWHPTKTKKQRAQYGDETQTQLRLPTSSGLDSRSPSSDKKCKESLGNPSNNRLGSIASYISSKSVAVVPFSCQIQSLNVTSVSLLRLNCNKMESTAALCNSFSRISDQSATIRKANSQSEASGRGVHACCQTADVNYWHSPPLLFPLLKLGFFRREVREYVNKMTPYGTQTFLLATMECQWLSCNK